MKIIMLTLLSFLLFAVSIKAEAPKTLADYKAIYEREQKNLNAVKEGAEIEQKYLAALTSLERDYKKAGDFPGTKAVLEEKKRFEACRLLPDATPDGAIQGIADAQKDCRNAYAEADAKRKARLEKLTTQYIKALKGYTRNLLESDKMTEAEEVNGEVVKAEAYLKTMASAPVPVPNGETPISKKRESARALLTRSMFSVQPKDSFFRDGSPEPTPVPINDPSGLWNLSLLKTAKANASSIISGYPLKHAIVNLSDGWYNNNASWISSGTPAWAEVDLGDQYLVQKVVFGSEHVAYHKDRAASKFRILVAQEYNENSSASSWTEVYRHQKEPVGKTMAFSFPSIKCRYVRIDITESAGGDARIDELEIYGK